MTQVPPPNGTTATWCSTAQASTAATSSAVSGRTTASGASDRSPVRARSRSGVDLPRVRSRRVSSSVSTCSAPSAVRSSSRTRVVEGGGRQGHRVERRAARRGRRPSRSGPARCRGGRPPGRGRPTGRGASRPGSGPGSAGSHVGVMCYSVTYDVTSSQPRVRAPAGAEPRRRLPGRRPRLHPRRGLAPYDADRGRPPRGRLPDDDLPHLAGHADPARRPDDPRVGRRGHRAGRGPAGDRPARSTGWSAASSARSGRCARTSCSCGSSSSTPS